MRTGAILVAAALAACASPERKPDGVRLEVPFFAGDPCGPSALAAVMTYWHEPTEPKALKGRCDPKGELPADLLLAAQGRGLQARSFQATPQDLRDELKLGHPLVVYVKKRFVVVTGYDDARGGFYVHDSDADAFVPYRSFVSKWERTGRWALVLVPAGERSL